MGTAIKRDSASDTLSVIQRAVIHRLRKSPWIAFEVQICELSSASDFKLVSLLVRVWKQCL